MTLSSDASYTSVRGVIDGYHDVPNFFTSYYTTSEPYLDTRGIPPEPLQSRLHDLSEEQQVLLAAYIQTINETNRHLIVGSSADSEEPENTIRQNEPEMKQRIVIDQNKRLLGIE